jgi:hypothetical protein
VTQDEAVRDLEFVLLVLAVFLFLAIVVKGVERL